MKTNLLIGLILFVTIQSFAQTKWYKYPGNLTFEDGQSGWYWRSLGKKAIIYDNGQYQMWYSAFNENDVKTLGYATSKDGITWIRYEGDSINFECVDESWDSRFNNFDIIKTDTAYFMWYTLRVNENNLTNSGFAWSKDGMNWTKYPEPVLKHGTDDEWDAHGPYYLSVIFDGHLFRMFYSGYAKSWPTIDRIGLATSMDGVHWDKHPSNPILVEGEHGSWDDQGVGLCNVVFNGSNYHMWYSGNNLIRRQIGYASSFDGIHWTKSNENPVLRNGKLGERDSRYIHSPEVIYRDSIYRMWYFGSDTYRGFRAYATTSMDEFLSWDTAKIMKLQREIMVEVFGRSEYIKVDSLTNILPELSGIDLVDAYNWLALAYSQNDESKSLFYADKAMAMAGKLSYPEGKAMASYSKGKSQIIMDNYGIVLNRYLSSLRIFDSLEMLYEKGDLLLRIAAINSFVGSMDITCSYARQALAVYEQLNDTGSILRSLSYLGWVSLDNGDTTFAIEAFKRKFDIGKYTLNIKAQAANYQALGVCYSGRKLDSALYYFNKTIMIYDSLGLELGFWTYLKIADAYFAAGPEYYKEAEAYYSKCFERYWIGSAPNDVELLNAMAELYLNTGRYDKCREFLDVSLKICRLWLSRLDHQLFFHTGKAHNEWLLKSCREKIYRLYFRLDTVLHNEASALMNYMLATHYKDSIYNDRNKKQWAMLQDQYETESAQSKITILQSENEVKDLRLQQSRILLFGFGTLVFSIILAAIIFIRNRNIKAQHTIELERIKSEKLRELDHLKSRFFANISHEFRTPLTLIMGPLDRVLSKSENENDKKELSIAKKYAGNLQNLINNLLSISKLESGKMLLYASEIDIVKLVKTYIQSFESLAKQRNISLIFTSENKVIKAFIDREKFEQVLNNLLSNAFKYTNEGGRINVGISSQPSTLNFPEGAATITVSDTGYGIAPEQQQHIFDRFYQVLNNETSHFEGTGIGLSLTKELVGLHHGIIKVESESGKGSTFTILLPLGEEHLKPEEKVSTQQPAVNSISSDPESQQIIIQDHSPTNIDDRTSTIDNRQSTIDNPILLIVEDNADMRSHIRKYFENEFQIIEAIDGIDGYKKSTEHIPDIIISDVMMPNMDGNEFCKKVKTDECTSHIPVILLTARASKESRIEGLETGADDFITKPFDGDELQVRVKNLIDQRKQISVILERKFQKSHSVAKPDFEDSGITSMDERFLQKVIDILKEHHSDSQFNTNAFGRAVGLSKAQLNRKIKALTGQTTGSLIRIFRLTRAAELIKKKSATVAEIAYDVGFNSPSYFSECFKIHFGKLPSEFSENQ